MQGHTGTAVGYVVQQCLFGTRCAFHKPSSGSQTEVEADNKHTLYLVLIYMPVPQVGQLGRVCQAHNNTAPQFPCTKYGMFIASYGDVLGIELLKKFACSSMSQQ